MSWFFNREQSEYEFIKSKLGKKLCSVGFKDIYIVNAQDLFECNLKPYWGQRAKDEIHINTIAQGIKNSQGLFHPLILANIIPREEISILDGQHRYLALSKLSETQRRKIDIQVDILNYEDEDDEWILTQYQWINTTKSMSGNQLQVETDISRLVNDCVQYFGKIGGGYNKIDDFSEKNQNSSRLIKSLFKQELLKKADKINLQTALKTIIDYNEYCTLNHDIIFKDERIGKKTYEECMKRKFWLGINFPNWLDRVFS
jgi:hypothetical protein